jgi:hypothetical protein
MEFSLILVTFGTGKFLQPETMKKGNHRLHRLLGWKKGSVGKKPFESGNNTPFQRHSCPGLDFWSENALFAVSANLNNQSSSRKNLNQK